MAKAAQPLVYEGFQRFGGNAPTSVGHDPCIIATGKRAGADVVPVEPAFGAVGAGWTHWAAGRVVDQLHKR